MRLLLLLLLLEKNNQNPFSYTKVAGKVCEAFMS
jgi:hypothetical protein